MMSRGACESRTWCRPSSLANTLSARISRGGGRWVVDEVKKGILRGSPLPLCHLALPRAAFFLEACVLSWLLCVPHDCAPSSTHAHREAERSLNKSHQLSATTRGAGVSAACKGSGRCPVSLLHDVANRVSRWGWSDRLAPPP